MISVIVFFRGERKKLYEIDIFYAKQFHSFMTGTYYSAHDFIVQP